MNYKKINEEVLKCHFKDLPTLPLVGEYDGKIAVSNDAYCLYLVPKADFVLDIDKLLKHRTPFDAPYMMKNHIDQPEVFLTGEMAKLDKDVIVKVGEKWIREKFLKYFYEPTFRTGDQKTSPVYVYEFGELAGLIMAVHRDADKK